MTLPEFRVSLTRLKPNESAYPIGDEVPHYEYHGRRTKLGGIPDFIQGGGGNLACERCNKPVTFVAQIDSVEHDSSSNPHAVSDWDERKWMFGDVGMIYVFFCFDCLQSQSFFECG